MSFRNTSRLAVAAFALAAWAAAPLALGAQYTFNPRVDQFIAGDDNIQVAVDDQAVEAYSYQLRPSLNMSIRGDRLQVDSETRLDFYRFDEDGFDTDDQYASLGVGFGSETRLLQMDVSMRRQSQRTSELDTSGILTGAERVEAYSARPSFVWQLDERYRLSGGISLNAQQYALVDFNDYKTYGGDLTLTRQLDETQSVNLTIFSSEFATAARGNRECAVRPVFDPVLGFQVVQSCSLFDEVNESTTLGMQVGYQKTLSESSQFGLSLGVRDVESRDVFEDIQTDCVFDLGLTSQLQDCTGSLPEQEIKASSSGLITRVFYQRTGERNALSADFERSIVPAGLGFLIQSDQLNAKFSYRLQRHVTLFSGFTVRRSESATDAIEFDREFYAVNLSLSWQFAENWVVGPGLRWRTQDASFQPESANSFSGYVQLSYRPTGVQLSR